MDKEAAVLALIEEAEQRHGTSMYCKVTTYELRQALGQDVSGWPEQVEDRMPERPRPAYSVANLELRTGATWKVGDTGLVKTAAGGHILIGAHAAEKLGMVAGTDGWEPFTVVP